jgi:hypothetical protein
MRAKWLRESGGRSSRSRGGKGKRAQPIGADLEWVRETFDSALQTTMTSAKSGWVRWQLSSLRAINPSSRKAGEPDGGSDGVKARIAKPHAADASAGAAAANASQPTPAPRPIGGGGLGGLGGLGLGSLSSWRPFGQQPAAAEPLASSGGGAELAPQAAAVAAAYAANSTTAPAGAAAPHHRGMDSATTALDGSPFAIIGGWFSTIFSRGAQQAAVAERAEGNEPASEPAREVDAVVVLEADGGAVADGTGWSGNDSVLVVPVAADDPGTQTQQI